MLVCGREKAREYYEASLDALRSPGQSGASGSNRGFNYVRSGDEELTCLFLIATAVVPALYESNEHIAQVCVCVCERERVAIFLVFVLLVG